MDGTLFSGDMVMGIDQFPTIDIRLSGVLLHLSPYQYFLPNPMDIREFYLGLAVWGEVCIWSYQSSLFTCCCCYYYY